MAAVPLHDSPLPVHVPVMLREVIEFVSPRDAGIYVDATLGGAGHTTELLRACPGARVIAADRDCVAVSSARERLAEFGPRVEVVHASFDELGEVLAQRGVAAIDGLIADLGVSSLQLDAPERGLSFRLEGPLDMRMDRSRGSTARELIAELSVDELANVIYELGEERRSRRVARCIKQALEANELESTWDLRRAVVRAVGPRRIGGVDPATRTFQAIRIAVNQELDQLRALLAFAGAALRPGGVVAIISFHSLEDRLVKRALLDRTAWERLTPKPLVPGEVEQAQNPRSRSAKLRAGRRLGSEEGPS